MSEQKLQSYFETLDFTSKILLCKNTAVTLLRYKKAYDNACESYANHNGVNTGARGGKHSSLYAAMETKAKQYQDQLDMYRFLSQLL